MSMTQQSNHHSTGHRRRMGCHVKALAQSGLSRAEYCRQHNLSYHAMIYWQKKLSRTVRGTTTLVPITIGGNRHSRHQTEMKINLPGGWSVELGDNFSPKALSSLLTILSSR
jgi:hypothetical protein